MNITLSFLLSCILHILCGPEIKDQKTLTQETISTGKKINTPLAPNSQQFKVAILKIVFCILLYNLALNAFYCLCRLSKDYARENRNGAIAFGRVT